MELKDGVTTVSGTNYYVRTAVTGINANAGNSVVYIVGNGSVTFSQIESNVNVRLASDGSATEAPTKYYKGLDIVASSATYAGVPATASAPAGISMTTDSDGDIYGVLVTKGGSSVYYPEGADVTVTLADSTESVTVLKGGVVTVNGAASTAKDKVLNTIKLEGAESAKATAVIVSGDTSGNLKIVGTQTGGSTSVTTGKAVASQGTYTITSGNPTQTSTGKPMLNAYADAQLSEGATLYATASWTSTKDAIHVYGTVDDGTVGNNGVTLVNATVSKLTLSDGQVISAEGASATINTSTPALSLTSGTLKLVSGEFEITGDGFSMTGDKTRLDIGSGATLTFTTTKQGGVILGAGTTINVYGKITTESSTIAVTIADAGKKSAATFNAYSGAVIGEYVYIRTTNGTTDGAMKEVTINDNWNSSVTFSQFQAVRVTADIIISEGISVGVLGTLTIDDGASITIKDGANLFIGATKEGAIYGNTAEVEILGDLEIEAGGLFKVCGGKSMTIYGNVDVSGRFAVMSNTTETVLMAGAVMTVNENALLNAGSKMTISAGAEVTVEGYFVEGSGVKNAGTLVFDGATVGAEDVTISMIGDGAVVEFREAKLTYTGSSNGIVITDDGLTFADGKPTEYANKVVLTGDKGHEIEGLTVTESVTSYSSGGKTNYSNYMDLSGNVEGYNEDGETAAGAITLTATGADNYGALMTVTDSLVIGEGVAFTNAGSLAVFGELTHIDSDSSIANTGTIEVYGTVKTLKNDTLDGTVIAAMYTVTEDSKTYKIYATLPAAVESGAESITVMGDLTVNEDLTIPEGVTVKASGKTVTVGSADDRTVTLAVEEGAVLKDGTYDVLGTLYFYSEKKSNKTTTIESEVRTSDGEFAKYTNVYTALSEAVSGETVKATGDVSLTQDITIPEGVILQIPAGISMKVADGKAIAITVKGAIVSYSGIEGSFGTDDGCSALKISGDFVTFESKSLQDLEKYYAYSGAYYTVTDTTGTYAHLTTLENAVEDAQDAKYIYVCGNVSSGDITLAGTSENVVWIALMDGAVLKVKSLNLDHAILTVGYGNRFDGTVASELGSVKLQNVTNFSIVHLQEDGSQDHMEISGYIMTADKGEGEPDGTAAIASGTVCAGRFDISGLYSFSISESATLMVEETMTADDLAIDGTLVVANGASLSADYIVVTGTLTVAEPETASATAGTLSVPEIYIGITAEGPVAAAMSAPGAVDRLETVYLGAGSTVSDEAVADLKSVSVFSVEGKEEVTVYTKGTVDVYDLGVTWLKASVFVNWQYTVSGKTYDVAEKGKVSVGDYPEFSALLDYNVFHVKIVADYGFADVFIDGAKVASTTSGIVQYIDKEAEKNGYLSLAAGSHTIEWKLKNNYNGDNVKTSFNGSEFSKSFDISSDLDFGKAGDSTVTVYKLVLTGATEQPQIPDTPTPSENKDEGMGMTDYLLIVLVVLIAVMAVMVALRLIRS